MTKLRKISDKLYITAQSFLLVISAGVLMCGIIAIFHDVFVLKMDEKKACYLAYSLPATPEERAWLDEVSKAGRPPAKITDRQMWLLEQEEFERKVAENKAKNSNPKFDSTKPYKVLDKETESERGDWVTLPSVEEAKKCGVSYRNPEKQEYPYIANRWGDWIWEWRTEEHAITDRVQYKILLLTLYPLPLVLFLFSLRRWLIWMAKD